MTVREYLIRQSIKAERIISIPLLFLFAAALFLPKPEVTQLERYIFVATFILLYSTFVSYFVSKVRCPSCKFSYAIVPIRERKKGRVNYCPGCGLSMESKHAIES